MSRFRLFGQSGEGTDPPDVARPDPRAEAVARRFGPPTAAPGPARPDQAPRRPVPDGADDAWPVAGGPVRRSGFDAWAVGPPPLTTRDPRVVSDPPTDPYGFPPVPALAPAVLDPAEAAALAGAFAVDYLSWDEDDPERRGRVLVEYLPTPGRDPARLGWTGRGRQRAEFALPGRVRPEGDGRVLVDVRVRVTPYRAVGEHGPPEPADAPEHADPHDSPESRSPGPATPGVPAAAPAPTGRGWRSLASTWVRLSVPIVLNSGRLVVDAWEETLGEEPPPPPSVHAGTDHALADDDPIDTPQLGGAW